GGEDPEPGPPGPGGAQGAATDNARPHARVEGELRDDAQDGEQIVQDRAQGHGRDRRGTAAGQNRQEQHHHPGEAPDTRPPQEEPGEDGVRRLDVLLACGQARVERPRFHLGAKRHLREDHSGGYCCQRHLEGVRRGPQQRG
ncbi:unnamed protein product, partial [Prorocentrum cordatum]